MGEVVYKCWLNDFVLGQIRALLAPGIHEKIREELRKPSRKDKKLKDNECFSCIITDDLDAHSIDVKLGECGQKAGNVSNYIRVSCLFNTGKEVKHCLNSIWRYSKKLHNDTGETINSRVRAQLPRTLGSKVKLLRDNKKVNVKLEYQLKLR